MDGCACPTVSSTSTESQAKGQGSAGLECAVLLPRRKGQTRTGRTSGPGYNSKAMHDPLEDLKRRGIEAIEA